MIVMIAKVCPCPATVRDFMWRMSEIQKAIGDAIENTGRFICCPGVTLNLPQHFRVNLCKIVGTDDFAHILRPIKHTVSRNKKEKKRLMHAN